MRAAAVLALVLLGAGLWWWAQGGVRGRAEAPGPPSTSAAPDARAGVARPDGGPAPRDVTPRFAGIVVDPRGRPVAGASVRTIEMLDGLAPVGCGQRVLSRTTTDEEGRFDLASARIDEVRLLVQAPGFAPFAGTLDEPAMGEPPPRVTLSGESCALRGRIVADGEPVPPATVRVRSDAMEVELETEAAPDGTFAFADLPPGEAIVACAPAGFAPATCRVDLPGEDEVALRLARGAVAQGIVTVAVTGAPVPGARVSELTGWPARHVETDAQGRYRYAGLGRLENSWFVVAEAPGYVRGFVEVPIPEDGATEVRLDLALWPAVAVTGTVVDAEGRPLQGAEVTLGRYESAHDYVSLTTDPQGRFRWDGLQRRAEPYEVLIHGGAEGVGWADRTLEVGDVDDVDAGVLVARPQEEPEDSGLPDLPELDVAVQGAGEGRLLLHGRTAGETAWTILDTFERSTTVRYMRPGTYEIFAAGSGVETEVRTWATSSGPLTLQARPAPGALTVDLRTAGAGAEVVVSLSRVECGRGVADGTGRVLVRGLPVTPGLTLRVRAGPGCFLVPAGTQAVELPVAGPRALTLRVLDASGAPVPHASTELQDATGAVLEPEPAPAGSGIPDLTRRGREHETDAQGEVRHGALDAGDYELWVEHPVHGTLQRRFRLDAAFPEVLELRFPPPDDSQVR